MKRTLTIFAMLTLLTGALYSQSLSTTQPRVDTICITQEQEDFISSQLIQFGNLKFEFDSTTAALNKANQVIIQGRSILFLKDSIITNLRANEADQKTALSDYRELTKKEQQLSFDKQMKTAFGCAGGFVACLCVGVVTGYLLHR